MSCQGSPLVSGGTSSGIRGLRSGASWKFRSCGQAWRATDQDPPASAEDQHKKRYNSGIFCCFRSKWTSWKCRFRRSVRHSAHVPCPAHSCWPTETCTRPLSCSQWYHVVYVFHVFLEGTWIDARIFPQDSRYTSPSLAETLVTEERNAIHLFPQNLWGGTVCQAWSRFRHDCWYQSYQGGCDSRRRHKIRKTKSGQFLGVALLYIDMSLLWSMCYVMQMGPLALIRWC